MSVSASLLIQFARNGLSCLKDWKAGPALIHNANVTNSISHDVVHYDLPDPYNKITPLEVIHGLTQLYPAVIVTKIGIGMLKNGYNTAHRVRCLLDHFPMTSSSLQRDDDNNKKGGEVVCRNRQLAEQLVLLKLVKDGNRAARDIFVSALYIFTGAGFFWLVLNSWHIAEAGWLGGVWAVLYAVEEMLFCLIFLLYYMAADGMTKLSKANKVRKVADAIISKGDASSLPKDLETFEILAEWTPFWTQQNGDKKDLEKEIAVVEKKLDFFEGDDDTGDDGEKEGKIRQEAFEGISDRLQEESAWARFYGYRELLFFLTNFVAFYGFTLGCLVYHIEEDENEPTWFRLMKFNLPHAVAEWRGNHAGNWMWTIEPLIVMSSPFLFHLLMPQPKPIETSEKKKTE